VRPQLRKLVLTAHVVASVGWLGALAVFLALALAALVADDPQTARAAYLAMDVATWTALVPFAVASSVTGVIESLGTSWGLVRHYWVAVKLGLTIVATVVLLMYTQTIGYMAEVAADGAAPRSPSPALHAGVGLLLLLGATALAVFKPRGMTRYGRRRATRRG
jgi:hypothetical protein